MSKFSSRQWLAIAGAFLFFLLLFFINRKAPPSANTPMQESAHAGNATVDFDQIIAANEDSLPSSERQLVQKIKVAIESSPDSLHPRLLVKLIDIYDSLGQSIISAYYTGKLAALEKSPELWTHAGQDFYNYSSLAKEGVRQILLNQAEQCFDNSLKIDSNYNDAQVGLGECMVEGSNPMQGIMTIEGVLRKDSNNRNAQLALGKFSRRSGQYEKAIYRFNKVLALDPSYKEAYIYLAQSYEEAGNKKEAIANLKKYRIFAPDSSMKAEIDSDITRLEKDLNK